MHVYTSGTIAMFKLQFPIKITMLKRAVINKSMRIPSPNCAVT